MGKIKTIAMYLPQFHQVRENDLWWGEGFTDWVAVKKALPLFKGHHQPREPLNDNFYDLMDKSVIKWQTELAHKYLIDGFCFYHYWFKNGKKILEKPAENLLKWAEIQMPFCFSWANESWGRSWSNIDIPNNWANKFETVEMKKNNDSGILLEQKYGDKAQWEDHFRYLLPFFKDSRYIKKEGKPLFIIYRPVLIPCIDRMIGYWQKLAVAEGLPGLYIIGTNMVGQQSSIFDANMWQMPGCIDISSLPREVVDGGSIRCVSYDKMWQSLLHKKILCDGSTLLCGMVDYDNTPRTGTNGVVVLNQTVEKFEKYFDQLVELSIAYKNSFVFLNAWNEWGESNYLEPDKLDGYRYLEAVRNVMQKYSKVDVALKPNISIAKAITSQENELERKLYRFQKNYNLMHQWLLLKEQGRSVAKYLQKKNYHLIAIYGMGINGKHLKAELNTREVRIVYGIDLKGAALHDDVPIYGLQDEWPVADVIIVTIVDEYPVIYKELRKKVKCPIISLDEILFEC